MVAETRPEFGNRLPLIPDDSGRSEQPREREPIFQRIEILLDYFKRISKGATKFEGLIAILADELLNEMEEQPDGKTEYYIKRLVGLFFWAAIGNSSNDCPLPPDFQYLLRHYGYGESGEDSPGGDSQN